MNSQTTLGDNSDTTIYDNAMVTDMEQKGTVEHTPVSAGTGSMEVRVAEARSLPGPACSKVKRNARTRAESAPRASARARSTTADFTAERKSRRETARNANRFAALANCGERDPIYVCSDSDESGKGPGSAERNKPPLKRRMAKGAKAEEPSSSEETKRKRGRPQSTGYYVGRGDAIERENRLKREALELEVESKIRGLSTSQILTTHKSTVDNKLEELEHAPTEDVAQRARDSMVEVWKVASSSKNLKGGYVRLLKQAAAMGTATAEVLSQRADNKEPDDDIHRQLKALRRELDKTKREAQAARKEAEKAKKDNEKLREELEEIKGRRGTRRGARAVIDDSPPTSPSPPPSVRKDDELLEPATPTMTEMEVDDPTPSAKVAENRELAHPKEQETPEYSDEKRRAEIMPPREEWPPVICPPIQGKVKVLKDEIITGTRVRLVEDTRNPPIVAPKKGDGPKSVDAQSLMDALAPKMIEWLKANLSALGLVETAGVSGKGSTRLANNNKKKGQREKDMTPNVRKPVEHEKKGGLTPTTIPNYKLWSAVVGTKSEGSARTIPTEKKMGPREPSAAPGSNAWVEVKNRKKKEKKKAPSVGVEAPAGKGPRKESKDTSREVPRGPTAKSAPTKKDEAVGMKPPRRKPSRTAAVTLTCPADGYAQAMKTVREKINLRDIGIEALKPRRAATGAIILEIPGPDGSEKAAVLRDRMEEALHGVEGAKVARPVKRGELRIKRILDSTSVIEVKDAISRISGCSVDEIRAGDIKVAPDGLGTLWVQCPLAAANKAAAIGKISIGHGWSTPTVQALEPRVRRCYKCLEPGHVQGGVSQYRG